MPVFPPTGLADMLATMGRPPMAPVESPMPMAAPGAETFPVMPQMGDLSAPAMPMSRGQNFGQTLQSVLPFIFAALAAKQGGRMAAGAMLQGFSQGFARKRQEDQAKLESEVAQAATEEEKSWRRSQYAQAQAEKAAKFVQDAIQGVSQFTDPAERARYLELYDQLGSEIFGLQPGFVREQLPTKTPDPSKEISEARQILADLDKQYGDQLPALMESGATVPFKSKPTTIRDLQALTSTAVTDPSGKAISPKAPTQKPEAASEFEAYLRDIVFPDEATKLGKEAKNLTTAERRQITLKARKEYYQADDKQTAGGAGGLSPAMESNVLNRLTNQWTAASKPAAELTRQLTLMEAGLDAAKRGDLTQGSQAVLVTFQKVLDPTSVVRESEYMRSAAGLALVERVKGAMERLAKGGAGVPLGELEKFATLARQAVKSQTTGYISAIKERIGRQADRYKIPRDLVFEDFSFGGTDPTVTGQPTVSAKEGDEKPIPGIPGGIAKFTNGKWIRIK